MAAKPKRFPWVATSAVAAALLVAVAAALRVPQERPAAGGAGEGLPALAFAHLHPGESQDVLEERLAAYDPTPMFIPPPVSGDEAWMGNEEQPGTQGPFPALPPALTKSGPMQLPSPVAVPATPAAGLKLTERAGAPLALGRVDGAGPALAGRAAKIEVYPAGGGDAVLLLEVPVSVALPVEGWRPLELMGAVTRAGLQGEWIVSASSGSAEIDDFFRSYLRENLRIDARLRAGFYVLSAGP